MELSVKQHTKALRLRSAIFSPKRSWRLNCPESMPGKAFKLQKPPEDTGYKNAGGKEYIWN